ncbi:MAG TPA: SRPBCC family protein [Gemmatimonadales bacterium]
MADLAERPLRPDTFPVSASAHIAAPPERVYGIIADYIGGHPRILPPRYFRDLVVTRGGYGAGTGIEFTAVVGGRSERIAATITEPVPGRVLVETPHSGAFVTTFRVEPAAGGADVTISTEFPRRPGLRAALERWISGIVLPRIFREELERLGDVARTDPGPDRRPVE